MWSWLAKIDPNTIVALLGSLFGFVWLKLKHERTPSLSETIAAFARQKVNELVTNPAAVATARDAIADAIWKGLALVKVKRSAALEPLVASAVEIAIAELGRLLLERQLAKLPDAMQGVLDAFEPKFRPMPPGDPNDVPAFEQVSGDVAPCPPDAELCASTTAPPAAQAPAPPLQPVHGDSETPVHGDSETPIALPPGVQPGQLAGVVSGVLPSLSPRERQIAEEAAAKVRDWLRKDRDK